MIQRRQPDDPVGSMAEQVYRRANKKPECPIIEELSRDERERLVNKSVGEIEKRFGKGSIMLMGDHKVIPIPVVSTGSLALDMALGIGGIPRGRIVEIYGPEASGKTTLALHMTAEAQAKGGLAAYVDAEHALDLEYARHLGVDVDGLLLSQPDSGEQALDIVEILAKAGGVDVVTVDSVAALTPQAEIDGEMGDKQVALQARLMSQAMRKLSGALSKSRTCAVFINQVRMKIGVMFGNPETTTGGNALKFYATQRMEIRRAGQIKDGDKVIGNRTRVKVVKNKLAPPFTEAEFDIIYGKGISRAGELVDLGVKLGVVEKAGAWYSFGGERLGQGREQARDFLSTREDIGDQVEGLILERMASCD